MSTLPSPILELQHALLPLQSAASPGVLRLLILPLFSGWDSHLNPSRSWECVIVNQIWDKVIKQYPTLALRVRGRRVFFGQKFNATPNVAYIFGVSIIIL